VVVVVFLNRRASYGRGGAAWDRVRPELERRTGPLEVVEIGSDEGVREAVREAAGRGERAFIAAGGDGTVHTLANALVDLGEGADVTLGAVGLGSSNDFHKPFDRGAFVCGVPVRVDCGRAEPRDVIRVVYEEESGRTATRCAVINASIGVAAEANAGFNEPTPFVRCVRRLSVDAAIVASVLRTLATYRDVACRIAVDGADQGAHSVSSLGIVKNPHFAGAFCYDEPVEPDDGLLGVHLCERLTRFQVLATLAALSRRRFSGRPKTRSWKGSRVSVDGERAFALEMDGEVVLARRAEFTALRKRLRCCR